MESLCRVLRLNIFFSINTNDLQNTYIVNIQRMSINTCRVLFPVVSLSKTLNPLFNPESDLVPYPGPIPT